MTHRIKRGWLEAGQLLRVIAPPYGSLILQRQYGVEVGGVYWTAVVFNDERRPRFVRSDAIEPIDARDDPPKNAWPSALAQP